MKRISGFLLVALALCGAGARAASPVATTVGSNLTAYNNNTGAINNAMWNSYVNPRANSAATAPTADFGNCNAIILRCAQPKCTNGGCSTMEIARPIVSGCVQSNPSCEQYGTDLIEYISAQLVASSTASANQAAADAQVAVAQAVAQQSAQQMAAMQQQMSQMQQQMQQQSADTAAQIQAALAQQQAATTQAIADVASANQAAISNVAGQMQATNTASAAATTTNTANLSAGAVDLSAAQQVAAASGVSADLLAREQISGQILTKIENAEVALKSAKAAMETAFAYAGCNSTGSNCTGPKRVSTFKNKAMQFFDPYNDVLDEVYDALILAQSVGVDITDIYMMLNGTCNVWGQYLCAEGQVMHYNKTNCPDGKSVAVETNGGTVYGGANCKIGQVVPMSDGGCQLIKMLTSDEEVQRNWLYPETGTGGVQVRVGCASEALDNSFLFRNRKKQADIDIETLQRIIEQDAPEYYGSSIWADTKTTPETDGIIYCATNAETYNDLRTLAGLKRLPDKVCVNKRNMAKIATDGIPIIDTSGESIDASRCKYTKGYDYNKCLCNLKYGPWEWDEDAKDCICTFPGQVFDSKVTYECIDEDDDSLKGANYTGYEEVNKKTCENYDGTWTDDGCDCSASSQKAACESNTGNK